MWKQELILLLASFVLFFVDDVRASNFSSLALDKECGPSKFRCSNGICIKARSRCDQNLDCLDGSDEVGCDQEGNDGIFFDDNTTATTVNSTSNDTTQIFASTKSTSPKSRKETRNIKFPKKLLNETKDVFVEAFNLLEEGDQEIELRPDYRDIVLVTGLTGAGKTTVAKFITNPNDLEAYNSSKRILIRDRVNDSITVNSTVASKTIFPQLLIHGISNTAFYDLPEFSDNQNATIEIANAFFIKKATEHAQRVTILLVVSHKGLRDGGNQTEFKMLIEHLIKFVKDIGKFSKDVVLVASKVEYRRENDRVIKSVGKFLRRFNADLSLIFQDPEKLGHAQAFLHTLLEKDEKTGKYKRIGIFKQPRVVGPLMDDPEFKSNQKQVQDLIFKRAQFVPPPARTSTERQKKILQNPEGRIDDEPRNNKKRARALADSDDEDLLGGAGSGDGRSHLDDEENLDRFDLSETITTTTTPAPTTTTTISPCEGNQNSDVEALLLRFCNSTVGFNNNLTTPLARLEQCLNTKATENQEATRLNLNLTESLQAKIKVLEHDQMQRNKNQGNSSPFPSAAFSYGYYSGTRSPWSWTYNASANGPCFTFDRSIFSVYVKGSSCVALYQEENCAKERFQMDTTNLTLSSGQDIEIPFKVAKLSKSIGRCSSF